MAENELKIVKFEKSKIKPSASGPKVPSTDYLDYKQVVDLPGLENKLDVKNVFQGTLKIGKRPTSIRLAGEAGQNRTLFSTFDGKSKEILIL